MLLTTPVWASGHKTSEDGWYWYPPADPKTYGAFVEAAVRRWHRQGGRLGTVERAGQRRHLAAPRRPRRLCRAAGRGLCGGQARRPDALVMVGSVYVHDSTNEGLAFMEQVGRPWRPAELRPDGHPHLYERPPAGGHLAGHGGAEYAWRIQKTREWLPGMGAGRYAIWVTEDGPSACSGCGNVGTSEQPRPTGWCAGTCWRWKTARPSSTISR